MVAAMHPANLPGTRSYYNGCVVQYEVIARKGRARYRASNFCALVIEAFVGTEEYANHFFRK